MIIVSGFNVFPNEIESIVSSCKGVAECACIGVPHDKTGEAVKLFIVKLPDFALTEKDVISQCQFEMTGYKVPKIVCFVQTLP